MIGYVLRLYPRTYRDDFGAELRDAYDEATAGASPAARVREAADIAAHALRTRLRLTSSDPAGRIAPAAALLSLAAAAAVCGLHLSRVYVGWASSPGHVPMAVDTWTAMALCALLVCGGAAVALARWWRWGSRLAAVGLLGYAGAAYASGPAFADPVVTPAACALTAIAVLACPPDLPPSATLMPAAGGVAAAIWLPLTAVYAGAVPVSTDYGYWPLCVLLAAGLCKTLRTPSPGLCKTLRTPSPGLASAMAALPSCPLLIAHGYTMGGQVTTPLLACCAVLLTLTAAPTVLRRGRRAVAKR
ncbi:hypothetical protein OKJ48_00255 [Streptomyces kunmingensis]|uniref:Integral membrane protein n=1 Tax=Streptomyces kunmingensis TaxID=68225 RepID=A0ABU6C3C4_9ACTN|nr:hypothetical protein [Streptomyces kunmingensis]MEB3958697.1 hypothetical protein [Streptomyces kunmingensis]